MRSAFYWIAALAVALMYGAGAAKESYACDGADWWQQQEQHEQQQHEQENNGKHKHESVFGHRSRNV